MQALKKKIDFLNSEEGLAIRVKLLNMLTDDTYATPVSYTTDSASYPDNNMPFVDKHLNYLSEHPQTNPQIYLANLRLMTRIRK
ncbi:MAG: hypothetical protein JWN38_260 [Candidatus Saccharibacteria bacterium]|nr:hypothetical protein [Candidatus Saccharibacteria bacterium]